MAKADRSEKGMPEDPVRALRARELLGDIRQLVASKRWKDAAPLAYSLVQTAPHYAEGLELLGVVALNTGAARIAEGCFERAVTLGPATASRLLNWGKSLLAIGEAAAAERVLHRALLVRPHDADILAELADAQLSRGRKDEALKNFRRVLKRRPDHLYAAHMATALTRVGDADRRYVTRLFDDYAGIFDAHLTETLAYRVPEQLAEMVAATGRRLNSAIDLGCGTGLVGVSLASIDRIDGIDLSPQMLEQARHRGIYRQLGLGDCAEILDTDPAFAGPYDLVIAADVFIYIGALESIFASLRQRLSQRGVVAFSIETSNVDPIEIRSSGRFAHSAGYILGLAERYGLSVLADQATTIRLEQELPIGGHLYLLHRE